MLFNRITPITITGTSTESLMVGTQNEDWVGWKAWSDINAGHYLGGWNVAGTRIESAGTSIFNFPIGSVNLLQVELDLDTDMDFFIRGYARCIEIDAGVATLVAWAETSQGLKFGSPVECPLSTVRSSPMLDDFAFTMQHSESAETLIRHLYIT